jgi:Tfp pilus assembly protein PilF
MKHVCAFSFAATLFLSAASAGIRKDEAAENAQRVKSLLGEAVNFAETGRYDVARKRCNEALGIDSSSTAAWLLLEMIQDAREKDLRRFKAIRPTRPPQEAGLAPNR